VPALVDAALIEQAGGDSAGALALAETAGDAERAAGLFAEAADGWLDYGLVLEHGLALLGAGRCRSLLGLPDGRAALRDAHAVFIRLGARPLAAEAGGLLRAATGS
jgi:hypothetical protein